MGFYKGYVELRGKSAIDRFKDVPDDQLKTLEQAKQCNGYGGVFAADAIMVDFDIPEHGDIMLKIAKNLKLKCRVLQTTRGKHFLFKNSEIKKCRNHATLAIGLEADIKGGFANSYQALKVDGVEREIIYDIAEGQEYDEIPKWLFPLRKKPDVNFINLNEGDGRNDALFNFIPILQNNGFTVDECRTCISVINAFVLKTPLDDDELEKVLRDDAFNRQHTSITELDIKSIVRGSDQDFELVVDSKGKVVQSQRNITIALLTDEKTKDMFRYNVFTDHIEVTSAWWTRYSQFMDDTDLNRIRLFLEEKYQLSSEQKIPRAIDTIAKERPYHPIREYLESLQWDGESRIADFFPRYLGAEKSDYTTEATKLMLMGAICRVYHIGCKFDYVISLVENVQGGGKSSLVRLLACKDEWFTDDLKNIEDENAFRKIQGHWIIEMSEMLAMMNASKHEVIKSFVSRQKDTYKVPYDKYPHDFPRQCIFIGTTNNVTFLPDDKTGNRRFIPIAAHSKLANRHPLDDESETRAFINQLWAEAMNIYHSGDYSLTASSEMENMLVEVRKGFTPEDFRIGIIQEWLNDCKDESVCIAMIWNNALNEFGQPSKRVAREIAEIMDKAIDGWERHPTKDHKVRIGKYGKQVAWDKVVPQLKAQQTSFDEFTDISKVGDQLEFGEIPFD